MGRPQRYSGIVMSKQLPPFRVTDEIHEQVVDYQINHSMQESRRLSVSEIVRRAVTHLEKVGQSIIENAEVEYGAYGSFTKMLGATYVKADHQSLVRNTALKLNLAEAEVLRRTMVSFLGSS